MSFQFIIKVEHRVNELIYKGHNFSTLSDTEVVLRAYIEWGINFAEKLNGMYAFAIWDIQQQSLILIRDRMGVKPLYYYQTSNCLSLYTVWNDSSHGLLVFIIALRMTSNLRIHATMATLFGLPASVNLL
ncbi:hypothetical protein XNC1_0717 [Xenorhabdus nematophila ATCC 19061]|uniref:asparagine synthase (glutamine-hydrolyzing) n=1 Tax=Xenorhabdus nematophila (strain ATCC 19061 / DSM 3370 / CCUG 14189 / LMG 1036 / NCIMB 9965 / AN6) TaxID=406817 RepID=D3VJN2_XENNA|nr:hypothetical protein XNC1_0717 [Xenorhabdus nematophila ATCC 19061]CEK21702.1 conserved protein of unknown function [Xenorhabdus nematophila AN6/1]